MDNIIAVAVFSGVLLLGSVLMMAAHIRAWRRQQREQLDEKEFDFRRRQFRRRMQTSAMIGLLAIALPAGYLLTLWTNSGWSLLGSLGVTTLLVGWVCLLALVDIWATKRHFGILQDKTLLEQTKLRAELRRMEAGKKNGHMGE